MPMLDRQDDVFVLDLGDGENRFHPDWIASVNSALDEVEKAEGPRALVTAATGKFYSSGLDLDWLFAHADQQQEYVGGVQELFARMLSLPVITVAALQGHTFAAGAMFSLAHDFRVMRADRGFWCLPEADINIPFTPGMSALIQSRLTPQTAHEAMTTARRYGAATPSPPPSSTTRWPRTPYARPPWSSPGPRWARPARPSAPSSPVCTSPS